LLGAFQSPARRGGRRRLKVIPNSFGEKPVLKLMFGALVRAAERWRGLRFIEFELRQIALSAGTLMPNTRPRSPVQTGRPKHAFPADPRLDLPQVEFAALRTQCELGLTSSSWLRLNHAVGGNSYRAFSERYARACTREETASRVLSCSTGVV